MAAIRTLFRLAHSLLSELGIDENGAATDGAQLGPVHGD